MTKRIVALLLCLSIVFPFVLDAVSALDDPVYDSDIGKYATLVEDANTYYVCDGTDFSESNAVYLLYEEFEPDTIFRIENWHWYEETGALWYQVSLYRGGVVEEAAEFWPETAWIMQGYPEDPDFGISLEFISTCETCGKPDCDGVHTDVEPTVTVSLNGETISGGFTMPKYDKPTLTAATTLSGDVSYRWQILAQPDLWVDIYGEDESTLTLSYAMVKTLLDSENKAQVRCIASAGEQEAIGEPLFVMVNASAEDAAIHTYGSAMPAAEGDELPEEPGEEEIKTYILSIVYVYGDESIHAGTTVAPTWSAEISPLQDYEAVIKSPEFPGYTPDEASVTFKYKAGELKSDVPIVVHYNPAEVSYTVLHRWQNVDNDAYSDYETETRYGKTESLVPEDLYLKDGNPRYPGMEPLPYAIETIAADGTTFVEIRYDRIYYLMTFDLDGGYGTLPVYARHGTALSIPNPTKPGCTFMGWDGNGDGEVDATPTVMPIGNIEYKAIWKPDDTAKVSFVFWGENADDAEYSYYGSKEVFAKPGTTINYLTGQNICGLEAHTHGTGCVAGCGLTEHTHGNGCYDTTNPICGKTEHTVHTEACYSCGMEEHTHVRSCYEVSGGTLAPQATTNVYNPNQYDGRDDIYYTYSWGGTAYYLKIGNLYYRISLNYGQSINNFSYYTDCGKTPHTHSDTCEYTCDYHAHTIADGCYQLTCTDAEHTHSSLCAFSCGKPAHTHNEKCQVSVVNKLTDGDLWTYDHADTDVVVREDGSTVVNVYFYRNQYQFTFRTGSSASTTVHSFSAKWGSNISDRWKFTGSDGKSYPTSNTSWTPTNSNTYSQRITMMVIMPAESIIFRHTTSDNTKRTFYYYIESLSDGISDNTRVFEGKTYELAFDLVNDFKLLYYEEDFFPLPGYDRYKSARENGTEYPLGSGTSPVHPLYFYYSRKKIDLTFNNGYEDVRTEPVLFGDNLSAFKDYTPEKPKNLDPESIYFDGWYLNPECSDGKEVNLDTYTMPAEPLILYAKWSKVVHTVRIWKFKNADGTFSDILEEDFQAPHNSLVQEQYIPETPGDEGHLKFDGWFYIDENGEEQAFDFENMPVVQDLNIYAKWRSDQLRDVTVRYVTEVGGVDVEIAPAETFKAYVGDYKTYEAKTENQLNEGYRTKYYPVTASSSITVSEDESQNELIFRYVYKVSPPYTVEYWIKNADGSLRPAFRKVGEDYEFVGDEVIGESEMYTKRVTDHGLSVVTEQALPAAKYLPDQRQKRMILSAEESENVIQFIYTYSPNAAIYTVNHYLVKPGVTDVDGPEDYDLHSYEEFVGEVNSTASANPGTVFGAEFDEGITMAQNPTAEGYTWDSESKTLSVTIKDDNSTTLDFFYTRIECEYRVLYIDQDTGTELDRKTDVKAQYGETVTETAKDFDGYLVDAETKEIVIQAGSAAANTITFYYTRKTADIQISKEVALDEQQAAENPGLELPEGEKNREFEFTVLAADKFHKSQFDYTITRKDGTVETGTVSVKGSLFKELNPILLRSGDKVVIHGLSLGDYTVKETHVIGYKTTVDAVETETKVVTLDDHGEKVAVNFLNTYPFFTGDLILSKTIRKAADSDPDGSNEVFTYTITVTPAEETLERAVVIKFKDLDSDGNAVDSSFEIPAGGYGKDYKFSLRLKAGTTVTVEDIPEGSIQVWETIDESHYATPYYEISYTKKNPAQDTTPGNSSVVNSHIYGGHDTTVAYTNTYKKDSLTIQKTVTQEYAKDSWQEDTFTFELTGETKLPDGIYQILIGGETATATVANGKVTLSSNPEITVTRSETESAWSADLIIDKLPAGTYSVQEINAGKGLDAYTQNPEKVTDLQLDDTDEEKIAAFTNTFKRGKGGLYLEKVLVPASGFNPDELPTDTKFSFTIVPNQDVPDDVKVRVAYSDGATQEVTLTNGSLTVELMADQNVTVTGLPTGEYRITETTIPSYANEFALKNDGVWVKQPTTSTADGAMYLDVAVVTGQTTEVRCTNTYPVDRAELVLRKLVTKEYDRDTLPEESFAFTVQLAEEDKSQYSYKVYNQDDTLVKEDTAQVTNRAFEITLSAGQYAVVPDMPVCGYSITEAADSQHYNISYQIHQTETATRASTGVETSGNTNSVERTFAAGKTDTVVFTNQYKKHLTNLTIDRNAAADPEQVFVYEVKNTTTGEIITVTVVGNGETTIHDLPFGDYTVTQKKDWSWRYDDPSEKVTLSAQNNAEGQAAKVVFSGSASEKWLDGVSQLVRNIFSGGSAG